MQKNEIESLKSLLAGECVLTDIEDRMCYSYDGTRQSIIPEVVVRPRSVQSVSAVLKFANEKNMPVYPRGAGTGLSGGAIPTMKGIVIDLSLMNRILEIDPVNMTAVVEPGVITGEFQKKVELQRLFYPPDPASAEFCTIGGNVSENAGGLRCVKYGVTRDYVLALEIVLPSGQIIHTGRNTLKSVTGYDLTRLFTGSEGTLGIFTRITLKLIPLPENAETLIAYFAGIGNAVKASAGLLSLGELPRALELMDEDTIKAVLKYKPFPVPEGASAAVIAEYDGNGNSASISAKNALEFFRSNNALQTVLATDIAQKTNIWTFRKAASPALYALSRKKLSEDIGVPRSRLLEILKEIKLISAEHGIPTAVFGHAGDGNLHVNFLPPENGSADKKIEKAIEELFAKTIEMGGTLSGEHGIGNTKARFLPLELGDAEIGLMRSIKRILDPNGILNPGKIFVH
ncbi:MAG: FAD-binding protein [Planctomycetes bacterium]|nr:FAD-binding protein [Planctomycetota bacterium]